MANPISALAISGIIAGAGGAGISAYGASKGGEASAKMYRYQAGVADLNTKIAKQNADYARATGEVEAAQAGMKDRFVSGKIIAGQSASGVDVASGTNVKVQEGHQDVAQMDQGIIRSNAARKAFGYEVEAANKTAQGQLYQASADQSIQAGRIGAISSILGGVSSVASKWTQAKQNFGSGVSQDASEDTYVYNPEA